MWFFKIEIKYNNKLLFYFEEFCVNIFSWQNSIHFVTYHMTRSVSVLFKSASRFNLLKWLWFWYISYLSLFVHRIAFVCCVSVYIYCKHKFPSVMPIWLFNYSGVVGVVVSFLACYTLGPRFEACRGTMWIRVSVPIWLDKKESRW